MTTINKWAEFFSGDYMGWARQPEWPDWEDLIGVVKLECSANERGGLEVTITSLEFGTWTGSLRLQDRVMEGSAGAGNTYFKFAFEEMGQKENIPARFRGGIYKPPVKLLLELHLEKTSAPERAGTGK